MRAAEGAAEHGDAVLEARARVALGELRLLKGRNGKVAETERDARRALTTFADAGDELGLAWAWQVLSDCRSLQSQFGEAERLLQEALTHAERAGDARKRGSILVGLAHARYLGPTPVTEAIDRTRAILDARRETLVVQAQATALLAGLEAMRGRFDDARQLCTRSRAIFEDLGERFWLAAAQYYFASAELLAGDAAAAERELVAAYGVVEPLGVSAEVATVAALLGEVELAQGRRDEAERHVELSRHASSPEDAFSEIAWRRTAARLLLHRDELDGAARLAREGVAIAGATDCLNARADALVALAEVEQRRGAPGAAREAFDDALRLYEAKGNVAAIAQLAPGTARAVPSGTAGPT
jgi:tetratricopeptide (TPR) repeat protein